jgi:hypothetical protein
VTEPASPPGPPGSSVRNVDYKGAPLDSEKGPGLGCFWTQLAVLAILLVLTPLSVGWNWPFWISATLLIVVLLLLLLAGQTVIFLLRLVAADRRAAGRRRPLASATPTVGELEDRRDDEATPDRGIENRPHDPPAPGPELAGEAADEPAAGLTAEDTDEPSPDPGPPGGGVRE